jgi:predicted nucleotidyltransferase
MDKKTALIIAQQYVDEVVKEMKPDKILLFGSYVNGSVRAESDIDIAVIFDGFKGDWFQACIKLSNLTWDISTSIEPVLLDSLDDKNGFVKEVLRTGELIYQQ